MASALAPDVDWPEPWSGGRVRGRAAVQAHLIAQRASLVVALAPLRIRDVDGGLVVTLHQVVRDADGDVLSDTTVQHTLTLVGGLVARLDVGEPPP